MNEKHVNDWLNKRKERKELYDFQNLYALLLKGDTGALSRAITLVESLREEDREAAAQLIRLSLPHTGNSIRLGITGVPGVGKSTFIESFGLKLIEKGKKVAVLAIDPSSEKTHGSILGDKTRMEKLSVHPNAFIRPSPAGDSLGGVARKTRESVFLCELAGFDVILIETVGVGQSETSVHSMVDFFLLLMLAGAGDELQGIKRGIMEMADLLVVTKADGENITAAQRAQREYKNAMHLFPPNANNWIPQAITASSFQEKDIEKTIEIIEQFLLQTQSNGSFATKRSSQDLYWLDETLKEMVLNHFFENKGFAAELISVRKDVIEGKISSFEAAEKLFKKFR